MRASIADLLPILALAGAFAPAPAQAKEAVLAIREAVAERLALPVDDVEVGALGLASGWVTDADWRVELPRYSVVGSRVDVTINATIEGAPVRLRVSPEIATWSTVPTAATDTAPGQAVRLESRRVRSDQLRGETPVDPTLAYESTTTIRAGQPVTRSRVRFVPDRREGEEVTVVVRSGAVEIRSSGTLHADAFVGATVPVVLGTTKIVKQGRWTADGYVILGGS